jgi:hypothetical protein
MSALRVPCAAVAIAAALILVPAAGASPVLLHDVMTGADGLGSLSIPVDPIQDYVQPDTQIEPSIAVNPNNPLNAVAAYQEGRIASGGDATNGFATTFDGGATWIHGELPGLTQYGRGTALDQGGHFERASDAVVAFGPNNIVYANSLVFDQTKGTDLAESLVGEDAALRSGIVMNVSYDGGRTWSAPVIIQDDDINGQNDKNWIAVDNSDAPGHHKGRVYVVWDRGEPVVYNYCDHDCDQQQNWLPDAQIAHGVVWPGQGIGAYPMVLKDGSLGMAISAGQGVPNPGSTDQPTAIPTGGQEFILAPQAGSTPWPAPLVFAPPIVVAKNQNGGTTAQRGSSGMPSAATDTKSGTIYDVWDDTRFRTDGKNDVVFSKSTDGVNWTKPARISGGPTADKVNHYVPAVSVDEKGIVHVMWRQRDESGAAPLYTDVIDTYYSESSDGGTTWTAPLKVNSQPSNPWYGAFSRTGTFEGDYDQIASAGGYSYIVREQGQPLFAGEPPALTKASATTVALTNSGKGHQHQRNWVAVVRDTQ